VERKTVFAAPPNVKLRAVEDEKPESQTYDQINQNPGVTSPMSDNRFLD